MKIVVTGATGFLGRHVVRSLVARQHEIIAVARGPRWPWPGPGADVTYVACDLHRQGDWSERIGIPDALIHLAWPGLPHYHDRLHLDENLPASCDFLEHMVVAGTRRILVAGTCFEYGMCDGELTEDQPAVPRTAYGAAKNALRLFLEVLQERHSFVLQWVRLFYLYEPEPHARGVLGALDRAIDDGDDEFPMTGGEQVRDYMSVEEAADCLAKLSERADFNGVVNCCSGQPISIRHLLERRIRERGATITLKLGAHPYRDFEPFAFWGSRRRLDRILRSGR